MNIVHFEINADNPKRAASFYKKVFKWDIKKWKGPIDYWTVMTKKDEKEPGLNGGLMKRMKKGFQIVNFVTVEKPIEKTITKIEKAGGKIVAPLMEVKDVGKIVYFKDTEGNVMAIMEPEIKK